jgi:phosphoserine phosphatase RsbU/P
MSGPDPTEDLLDLYENAPCGYLSLAPDSTIVRANRTLLGWLDLSADDLVGKPLRDLLGTGGRIAYETHLAPLLRLQGFVYEIALDLRCDRGLVPVIANASEKRDKSDNHLFTRLTLFRAEDRRKYERNLLEAKIRAESEAEQRDREAELREQFIAVLGHDLRNPVAALKAGTDLLKDSGNLGTEDREIVTFMDSTLDRSIELINNVMDFARGRLGSGISLDLQPAPDLDRKLETVIAEAKAARPDRDIRSEIAIETPVECDPDRLAQLLSNLLSNALHHGRHDAPVVVKAITTRDELEVSVTNSGTPIPANVLETLFQPFDRGSKQGNHDGLGLGLFIVDQIATAHGGRMEVASDESGTTFKLVIPSKESE